MHASLHLCLGLTLGELTRMPPSPCAGNVHMQARWDSHGLRHAGMHGLPSVVKRDPTLPARYVRLCAGPMGV